MNINQLIKNLEEARLYIEDDLKMDCQKAVLVGIETDKGMEYKDIKVVIGEWHRDTAYVAIVPHDLEVESYTG